MQIDKILISLCNTHHIYEGKPFYDSRFISVLKFSSINLAAVRDKSGSYHIKLNGKAAYKDRFDASYGFYCGRAAVLHNDAYFHIDTMGNRVYPEGYDWAGNYQEDLCVVRKGNEFFHIDLFGNPVYVHKYQYVGDFKDGIAVVYQADEATHINRKGEYIHNKWFRQLDIYHKGYARAEDENGWFHVDKYGRQVYSARYKSVEHFYNDLSRVEDFDGGIYQINIKNEVVSILKKVSLDEIENQLPGDMVGFWKTFIIYAGVKLKIFDFLPSSLEKMSKRIKVIPDNLIRILRALWELGVVQYNTEDDKWLLTEKGNLLVQEDNKFFAAAAIMWANVAANEWLELPNILQASKKIESHKSFKDKDNDEFNLYSYQKALEGYVVKDLGDFVKSLKLANKSIISFGRSSLAILKHILYKQPNLDVTALIENKIPQSYLANTNIKVTDNLSQLSKSYDVAFLVRFLHYFDDDGALMYLKKMSQLQIKELLIFETLISNASPKGGMLDINMIIETGGRLRAIEEWSNLLSQAGYEIAEKDQVNSYLTFIKASLTNA